MQPMAFKIWVLFNYMHNKNVKMVWIYIKLLSLLEIKHLNSYSKDKCKKHWECTYNGCNNSKKIMSKTKITTQKLFHSFTRLKPVLFISKLRSNQSIQCPRYWTCPIVPSPPSWNPLLSSKWKTWKERISDSISLHKAMVM